MSKIDPHRFTNGEKPLKSLRPGMSGVYHSGGYKQASNGYIYIRLREKYPKQYEGKVVYRDGTIVQASPPKYTSIIPDKKDYREYSVDVKELEYAAKTQAAKQRNQKDGVYPVILAPKGMKKQDFVPDNYSGWQTIVGTSESAAMDPMYLKKFVDFMKARNSSSVWIRKERSQARAVVAYSADESDMALVMPIFVGDETKERAVLVPLISKRPSENRISKAAPIVPIEKRTYKDIKKTSIMTKSTKNKKRKASDTMKRASSILAQQKSDYKRIFKSEISKGGNSKTAAKRAGVVYRKKYGATPAARWNNARKLAKRFVNA